MPSPRPAPPPAHHSSNPRLRLVVLDESDLQSFVKYLLDTRQFDAAYRQVVDPARTFDGETLFRVAMYYLKRGVAEERGRVHDVIRRGIRERAFTTTMVHALISEGEPRMPGALWIVQLRAY